MGTEEQIAVALLELSLHQWDFAIFSEARAPTGKCDLDGNHILFASGQKNEASEVAILVYAKWRHAKIKCHRVNHRVMAIDAKIYNKRTRIIAAYLPHAGYDDIALASTYDDL